MLICKVPSHLKRNTEILGIDQALKNSRWWISISQSGLLQSTPGNSRGSPYRPGRCYAAKKQQRGQSKVCNNTDAARCRANLVMVPVYQSMLSCQACLVVASQGCRMDCGGTLSIPNGPGRPSQGPASRVRECDSCSAGPDVFNLFGQ